MKPYIVFFICLGWIRLIFGQTAADSPPPLPEGPLLKRTPEFSTWTVVSHTGGGASESTQNLATGGTNPNSNNTPPSRKVLVTKTGRIIHEQLSDASGKKSEVWHDNGVQILVSASGAAPLIFPDYGGGDIYTPNYAVTDFAGLEWISPKTYSDLKKVMGRDCIIFRGEVNAQPAEERREMQLETSRAQTRASNEAREKGLKNPPVNEVTPTTDRTKVPAVACIDLETRLPIVVTFGKETRLYQYGTPPGELLVLPSALTTAHGEFQHKIQELARLPASP